MADKLPKPVMIGNFQRGVAQSPFVEGFSDMRNLDITTQQGTAKLNFALGSVLPNLGTAMQTTFTLAGSNEMTVASTFRNSAPWTSSCLGRPVRISVSSGGSLPTDIVNAIGKGNICTGGVFWLGDFGSTTVKIATSYANAIGGIWLTVASGDGAGSGTFYMTAVSMGVPTNIQFSAQSNTYYLQDSYGQVWSAPQSTPQTWTILQGNSVNTTVSTSGGMDGSAYGISATAYGQGLVVFNNYLLSFTNTTIEVFGPLNSTPKWMYFPSSSAALTWQTIAGVYANGSTDHMPFYSSLSNAIYWIEEPSIGNQWDLGAVVLTGTTFNPETSSTYTFQSESTAALILPADYIPRCIALVGTNLMIGTDHGYILIWDTHSANPNSAILCDEQDVTAIVAIGNFAYISAGYRGNIYMFNGYYTQKVAQIPPYLTQIPSSSMYISRMIRHNERIYMGVCNANCGGIWSFNPNSGVICLENEVSEGSYSIKIIPLLFSISNTSGFLPQGGSPTVTGTFSTDQLLVGWIDNNSVWGLDYNNATTYCTSGYMETSFFNIGLPEIPRALNNYLIMLGAKLTTGQVIKIWSRGNLNTAYATTGGQFGDGSDATFDYTTYVSRDEVNLPFGKDWVNVQFKIVVTSSSGTPSFNNIQIN